MRRSRPTKGTELTVDLEACEIRDDSGRAIPFKIDEYRRTCLLEGLDDIGITLQYEDAIAAYEAKMAERQAALAAE